MNDLKESLEFLKKYIKQFLLETEFERQNWSWKDYIDWQMPSIEHAIDHIINDHCQDKTELNQPEDDNINAV